MRQLAESDPCAEDGTRPRATDRKSDVHILLGKTRLINLEADPIKVDFDGRPYQVNTSLDLGLQQYLLKRMDRVNSRYIGIVAMAPDTGRILAMAGFNKIDPRPGSMPDGRIPGSQPLQDRNGGGGG